MSPIRERSPTSVAATITPSRTTILRWLPVTGFDTSTTWPSARSGSPSTATSRSVARRRDEPRHLVAVLGAVADRVDVRVAGAQVVVDDDAAPYVEAGAPGKGGR